MIVNVWLVLRADAQALIVTRLNWDEEVDGVYSGPVPDRAFRLFRLMADWKVVQAIFRIDTDGANDWHLWNVYFDKPKDILLKVRDEIDWLLANFPNQTRIGGAWHFDSRQVGTQFTRDADGNITGVTGAPTYPIHARALELMPDIITRDADGNVTSTTRPTALTDVNLLQGQEDRRFAS